MAQVDQELLAELLSQGVDREKAMEALIKFPSDMDQAIEFILGDDDDFIDNEPLPPPVVPNIPKPHVPAPAGLTFSRNQDYNVTQSQVQQQQQQQQLPTQSLVPPIILQENIEEQTYQPTPQKSSSVFFSKAMNGLRGSIGMKKKHIEST